jgi:hypothetical protein
VIRAFYAERLACAFWPAKTPGPRPAPFAGGDYPTLVLNSDSDPATPVSNGIAVFKHAKNASMITMQGGPHVISGRGLDCPDVTTFALMLDGQKPAQREQVCKQDFLDPYVPLTVVKDGDSAGLEKAIETELGQATELVSWDGAAPLTIGCDFGGKLTADPIEAGFEYRFKDCALWSNLRVSGTGRAMEDDDAMIFDITTAPAKP